MAISFDLQIFPGQMRDGARLIEENPEIDFILQHTGMLTDHVAENDGGLARRPSPAGPLPNLYSKLSAFGTFVHRNDPALIAYIVDNAMEIFGSERLLFGSNFPIEKLWTKPCPADAGASRCRSQAWSSRTRPTSSGIPQRAFTGFKRTRS